MVQTGNFLSPGSFQHKLVILFAWLLLGCTPLASQVIWLENFSGAPPAPGWTQNFTDCDLTGSAGVVGGRFEVNDMEGTPCCPTGMTTGGGNFNEWVTNDIDIQNRCNVSISVQYGFVGTFECEPGGPHFGCTGMQNIDNGHDQIVFEYSIDGGPWIQFSYVCGGQTGTATVSGLSGNTIRVRILPANKSTGEIYWFDNVTISATPGPTMNQPANVTVCSGQTIAVNFAGAPVGSTYAWTNDNTATGLAASGNGNINTPAAAVSTQQISTITVTPTLAGCPGTPRTFTVTVNPGNTVDNPGPQSACAGTPVSIDLMGSAATFNWTNSNPAIGLGASGSGDINFNAANVASVTTANITVTPTGACAGPPTVFQITINPRPAMNQPANITVCSGATANVLFTGGPTGTTYNWTSSNSATGIPDNGSGNISQPTASVTAPTTTTITVTPTSAAGCVGNARTFNVTVNPTLTIDDPANVTVCSGENVMVDFTGTANNFTWTNSNTTIGLGASGTSDLNFNAATVATTQVANLTVTPSGACPGPAQNFSITVNPAPSVNQPANVSTCGGQPITVTFSGSANTTFSWTNSNTAIGLAASGNGNISFTSLGVATTTTATITVTPNAVSGTCTGTPRTFTITLNPGPAVAPLPNLSLCAGQPIAASFTGAPVGSTYNWTNTNTAIGLPASGTGDINQASSAVATVQTGTISVTATNAGCTGPAQTFTVTVSPIPSVNQPANVTVCGGDPVPINFTGSAGAIFNWTNDNTAIGLAATGSGNLNFTAANVATQQVATVTVTPSVSGNTCAGTPRTFTITVRPTPTVAPIANQSVCAGAAVNIPTTGSAGSVITWESSNTAVGGPLNGGAPGIQFTAAAVPGTTVSTFTVFATAGTCSSTPVIFTLTVNPAPSVDPVLNQTVCAGTPVNVAFTGSAGATFNWTNDNPAIGLGASGSGNIAFTAGNSSGTANITVTPNTAQCPGTPRTFVLVVNALPTLTVTSVTCAPNLLTYSISVTSDAPSITSTAGTVGGTAPNFTVTGIPAGTNVTLTAFNPTTACTNQQVVNAPNCNCAPVAPATNPNDPSICEGAPLPALTVTAAAGLAVDWYAAPTGGVALLSNNTSFTPAGPLAAGTYTFYAETRDPATSCVSPTRTAVTLTVNPSPTLSPLNDLAVCAGDTVFLTFTGSPGVNFNWTNSNTAIGLAAAGTGNFTLPTPTTITATEVATLIATPEFGGCFGPSDTFLITVNPLPTLALNSVTCAPNLLTYSVSLNSSAATLTASHGVVSGSTPTFTITGIPADTALSVVATTAAGCSLIGNLPAPNCNCPAIPVPTNPSNVTLCDGLAIPALTVTVGTGLAADWYDAPTGGTLLLANSTTFAVPGGDLPVGTTSYYVETRDPATGCLSATRTLVTVTVKDLPSLAPVADQDLCANDSLLVTFVPSAGATVSWTNNNTAIGLPANGTGNLAALVPANLASNQQATIVATPQLNGCAGPSVTFTVNANASPTLTAGTPVCAADLLTYSITATSNAPTLVASAGTVGGTAPNYTVSAIPTGTNVILTATSAAGCGRALLISSPACLCPTINAPTSPNNPSICDGAPVLALTAQTGAGLTIDWYAAPTGGVALATGTSSFTPPGGPFAPGVYTFYAEARNLVNGCLSATRTEVTLTVKTLPTVFTPTNLQLCGGAQGMTTFAGGGNPTFTWTNSNTAIGLPASGSGTGISFTVPPALSSLQTATVVVTPVANGCTGLPDSFLISASPLPSLAPIADQTDCAGQPFVVNFVSNPPANAYQWNNNNLATGLAASGTTDISFTSLASAGGQTSTVTVQPLFVNGNHICSGPAQTFDINVTALPTVNDPADRTVCVGTPVAVAFGGTTGATFSWTNDNTAIGLPASGTGNLNFTPNATGTATVTVTPQLGANCPGTPQTFTITVTPPLTASITADTAICSGESLVLTASGGTSVAWSTGQNTSAISVNPLTTSTFTAIVSNNGTCADTVSTTVVVNLPYNVTLNATTCDPALVGTVVQNLNTVAGCDSTITTITAIDLVACAPVATLTGDTLACAGDADGVLTIRVTAGFASYGYTWAGGALNGTGQIAANDTDELIEDLPPGTYTVTVTSVNGASATFTATVSAPQAFVLSATAPQPYNGFSVSCVGVEDGSAAAAASGGTSPYQYLWSDSQTTPTASNLGAGDYSVTATDANGCTATRTVNLNAPAAAAFELSNLPIKCGDLAQSTTVNPLNSNGPYTVSLDGNPVSGLRIDIPAGSHVITLEDANGCVADTTVDVVLFPEVLVSLPTDTFVVLGQVFDIQAQTNLTAWDTLVWTPHPDTSRYNDLQQVWTPQQSEVYRLVVTDLSGCTGEAVMRLLVRQGNIYTPNVFSPNGDGTNDNWTISADASVDVLESVHIFDRWGDAVYIWEDEIPVNAWPGWDGKTRDRNAGPAVFVYYAWLRLVNGERVLLKGDITLMR